MNSVSNLQTLFCNESTGFCLHNLFRLRARVALCVCSRLTLLCVENTGSAGGCVRVVLVVVLQRQSLISRFAEFLLNAF